MKVSDWAREYGWSPEEERSFREYLRNPFATAEVSQSFDTGFLARWEGVLRYAEEHGAASAINTFVCAKRPVAFAHPDRVQMEIYPSFAGKIPVITLGDTGDFEQLVTNALYKGNRPENLSQIGATFAYGKTTRFLILSTKPYSNVPAEELGLPPQEWAEKSAILRREHECTHYYTKQAFGISRLHLQDELIADFFGIYQAFGFYRGEWFLRFLGLVGTSGGRLPFYTVGLSPRVLLGVEQVARLASEYLENVSQQEPFLSMSRPECIQWLCRTDLSSMAGLEE